MAEEKIEGEADDSRHGGLRRFSSPKMSRTVGEGERKKVVLVEYWGVASSGE